jgi:hypothetical protein
MDCRDWLVITPSETGLPDEVAGTPLLAVLSTVVLDAADFRSVSAVLTVGLLDDEDDGHDRLSGELHEVDGFAGEDGPAGATRYVLPTPDGQLALLAEFTVTGRADVEIRRRIAALMESFRWAT